MPSVTRSASKEERSSRAVSDKVQPAVDIEGMFYYIPHPMTLFPADVPLISGIQDF